MLEYKKFIKLLLHQMVPPWTYTMKHTSKLSTKNFSLVDTSVCSPKLKWKCLSALFNHCHHLWSQNQARWTDPKLSTILLILTSPKIQCLLSIIPLTPMYTCVLGELLEQYVSLFTTSPLAFKPLSEMLQKFTALFLLC